MNVRTWGSPEHPAILVFAGETVLSADETCDRLAAATRFVLRYQGDPAAAPGELDRLGISRVHVVGGRSAVRLARDAAGRVDSVALSGLTDPGDLGVPVLALPPGSAVAVAAVLLQSSGGWDPQGDRLADQAIGRGDPTGWFEQLYAGALAGEVDLPWNRTWPNPLLAEWAQQRRVHGAGRRAVVTGSGLGADVAYLASLGFRALGFDIAPSAVEVARRRHPGGATAFEVGDLLDLPAAWLHTFDLVADVITVQALPDPPRSAAIYNVGRLVAPGGTLVVVAYRDGAEKSWSGPPFPLTRREIDAYGTDGLVPVRIEELSAEDQEFRPRWRAEFRRP